MVSAASNRRRWPLKEIHEKLHHGKRLCLMLVANESIKYEIGLPPVPCTGRTVPITAMLWSSSKQPVLSYYFLCSLTVRVGVRDGRCLVNLNIA